MQISGTALLLHTGYLVLDTEFRHSTSIFLLTFWHVPLDEVIGDPGRCRLNATEAPGNGRERFADIQEGIRLLIGQNLLEPVINLLALPAVEYPSALLQQSVNFGVFVLGKV